MFVWLPSWRYAIYGGNSVLRVKTDNYLHLFIIMERHPDAEHRIHPLRAERSCGKQSKTSINSSVYIYRYICGFLCGGMLFTVGEGQNRYMFTDVDQTTRRQTNESK